MDGNGHEISIQHSGRHGHDGDAADDAKERQETVAHFPHLIAGYQRGKDGNVDRHTAELEGEDLPTVIPVEFKPEQLLEHFAQHQQRSEHTDHAALCLGVVLGAPNLADGHGHQHHQRQRKQMKPAKHAGAHITVIDTAPGPI